MISEQTPHHWNYSKTKVSSSKFSYDKNSLSRMFWSAEPIYSLSICSPNDSIGSRPKLQGPVTIGVWIPSARPYYSFARYYSPAQFHQAKFFSTFSSFPNFSFLNLLFITSQRAKPNIHDQPTPTWRTRTSTQFFNFNDGISESFISLTNRISLAKSS